MSNEEVRPVYNQVFRGAVHSDPSGRCVHPHDAATIFDESKVCLRAGHHCAQLITKWLQCVGTLRGSFYIYNTYEDVDKFIEVVKQTVDFFKQF